MYRTSVYLTALSATIAAGVVLTPAAFAGSYGTNICVSQKQKALGKHAVGVAKAWQKFPDDMTARDAAIGSAQSKLDTAWSKAEAVAVKKNSTCDGTTASSEVAGGLVEDGIAGIAGADRKASGKYVLGVMKAWSKYIKLPGKDPGKAKLDLGLDKAHDKYTDVMMASHEAADELIDALVEATTTSPDYPDTFQTETPGSSVVYGKQTLSPQCVFGDPYIFFARRGSLNKVLMYYQGGGACWDGGTCFVAGTCATTATAADNPANVTTGFGDYTNPDNPFYDWSVVFVTYCSCDVHWGQNIEPYPPYGSARHYGRVNAAVVEKFAREHFLDPEQVVATGSSAGSYGAIMNSYYLMKDLWPNADFSVMGDAGVGVITESWSTDYFKNWDVDRNLPKDIPGVGTPVSELAFPDLVVGLSERFPNARFGNYDASYDGGGGSQCNFFQVMLNPGNPGPWGNWWEPTCEWNACMSEFKDDIAARATNYRFFTGAGSRHTIFGSDKVYTETKSTTAGGTGVTFRDWMVAMIDDTPDWVNVDCKHMGGDCNLTNTCQGGTNAGGDCTTNGDADCPGGTCENDPDNANAPYANNDTVTCAPTACPCGTVNCPASIE